MQTGTQRILMILLFCLTTACLDSESLKYDCTRSDASPVCLLVNLTSNSNSGTAASTSLFIYRTVFTTNGNLIGPNGGDTFCNTNNPGVSGTYKALMVGSNIMNAPNTRIASISADVGDGQIDWVLKANTTYTRADGTVIGTTKANALFSFPLDNGFDASGVYWSGLNTDWTDHTDGCNATNGEWDTTTVDGATGNALPTDSTSISAGTTSCMTGLALVCVQQ